MEIEFKGSPWRQLLYQGKSWDQLRQILDVYSLKWYICKIQYKPKMRKIFSPNRPTGPIWSSSRDVCPFVCVLSVVPFPCDFLAWTESAFLRGPSLLFGGDRACMELSSGAQKPGCVLYGFPPSSPPLFCVDRVCFLVGIGSAWGSRVEP